MTDRRFWHCMLMALTLFGCSTHVDNLTKFHIKGEVLEQASGVPVQGAVLSFTDTGFDYVRSKNVSAQKIGESENGGKLNVKFAYSWGVNESLFANKPPQTFILSLEHPAYQTIKIPLRASDFSAPDNEVQVNLGIVKLTTRAPVMPAQR
ncbi:MAG: hypothetical protein AAB308_12105 [Nitrospirota bacterium]